MSGTDTDHVDILGTITRVTTVRDGAPDSLLVNGTFGNDTIDVAAGGPQVRETGLAAVVTFSFTDPGSTACTSTRVRARTSSPSTHCAPVADLHVQLNPVDRVHAGVVDNPLRRRDRFRRLEDPIGGVFCVEQEARKGVAGRCAITGGDVRALRRTPRRRSCRRRRGRSRPTTAIRARSGNPASWRTPEFLRDNGMLSIGAEFAYAAGYAGQGENIGMVDSGTFAAHIREHGSYDNNYTVADRFISVVAQGGNTGPTGGFVDPAFNDIHGTHVSGTIAASRDGLGEPTRPTAENMHGVAFNIDLYSGNTAKTDGVLYGKWPANATAAQKTDNAYIGNVYRAVNATVGRNGKPIRLITTSWGSQPNTENYSTLEPPAAGPATFGLNASVRYLTTPEGVADSDGNTSHWANGAMEAARSGTLIQFTAGNSGYDNPTARAAAAVLLPRPRADVLHDLGHQPRPGRTLNADGSVLVPGTQSFNQCGVAKWSCVTAPGNNINSTWWLSNPLRPTYSSASGTSMSGPHSAAVLALILQRFPYMTNTQALHTMYTTGRQNATIGSRPTRRPRTRRAARSSRSRTRATAGARSACVRRCAARASCSARTPSTPRASATCGR